MVHDLEDWQQELLYGNGDIYQRMVRAFIIKNDLSWEDRESQWKVVKEEFDELEEAWNKYIKEYGPHNPPPEYLVREITDSLYTLHVISMLINVDIRKTFKEVAAYNLQKSGKKNEEGKIIDDVDQDN